jgi:hypothetical protein
MLILALTAGIFGLVSLSQATFGVGLLAGACLLAIVARYAQAEYHHRRLLHVLQNALR